MVRSVKSAGSRRGAVLTASLLLSASSCTLLPWVAQAQAPASSASFDQLSTQAHYWEDKNRYDLARESWLKLLRVSPDNPQALTGLAMAEAKSGRAAAAQVYLDRLRETHPDSPGIPKIEDAIRTGSYDQDRLKQPRALAQAGKFDESVASYRQVFGNNVPDGRLGLEYYQTLAGTKDGWQPARDGIEGLVKSNPDEPIYQLALAQHLTYQEETRRQGISQLAQLSGKPGVGAQADQAWAQALIWLGAKQGDEPLYQSYLANHKNAQVSARYDALRSGTKVAAKLGYPGREAEPKAPTADQIRGQEVQKAYDKLNEGEVSEAAAMFEQLLVTYPDSDDAMGGLGIARLKQERYAEAHQYLQQASNMSPRRAGRWSEALSSARFWEQVRAAQAAREAGDQATAESLLRNAISTDPAIAAQQPSVKDTLADILSDAGDTDGAEALYREVLTNHPDDVSATRGLVGVLVKKNRMPEALALAERLPPDQKEQLGNLGALKGQYLRDQAKLATDAHDDEQAEQLLKQALLEDPESPWTRLDLSRIYQRNHRTREANTLIDGLLTGGKKMPEALYIKALLLAEQDDWLEGMQLLEQVPYEQRTQPMADLQRRLWVRYQTKRASVYARYGHPQEAAAILQQVEPFSQDSPELLGAMATALADLGEDGPALNYIRQALSRQVKPDPGLRLQYASLLFKLRQDAEFEVVMEELLKYPNFDEQESLDLANLRIAYRLRQADLVREEGNLARAYEYLQPLLQVNPNDPRLIMALARLYNDAKEFDKAAELYHRALQTDPNNLDAYKGAIGAALAQNKPDEAQDLLDEALRLDPQNARLYALAGRAARERGEDGRALQLYQQALRLDQQNGGESEFGDGRYTPQLYMLDPASSPVNNPFYGQAPAAVAPVAVLNSTEARATLVPASAGPVVTPPPRTRVSAAATSRPQKATEVATVAVAAEKKKLLTVVSQASPARARLVFASLPVRRHFAGRGGLMFASMPRGWTRGHLIKVASAPTEGSVVQVQSATSAAGSPGWVQTAPDRFSYTLQSPQVTTQPTLVVPQYQSQYQTQVQTQVQTQYPTQYSQAYPVQYAQQPADAPLPSYVPRQVVPNAATTAPRTRPQPASSLRQEVLHDIGEITGQQEQPYVPPTKPLIPPTPAIATPQPPGYPAGARRAQQQLQSQYIAVQPPQYVMQQAVPAPVVATAPPGVGATESEYARQGLKVLPSGSCCGPAAPETYVTVPGPAAPMPTYVAVPQLAPSYPVAAPTYTQPIGPNYGMQLRTDPLLGTPDFALQRRAPATGQPNEVLREIADINAKRTTYASFGLDVRSRDGQPGLDRLDDIETPVEFSVAGVNAGRFKLRAVPVFLDAGVVSGTRLPLFGAMGLTGIEDVSYDEKQNGIAVGAAYEVGDFKADFGSSPLGFPVETLVGGINWAPKFDDVSLKLDLSRRSVTDSLLSYAGTRDPATGNIWGGITKTGGRMDLAYDLNQYGVYVNASYHVLDGENVARNDVIEGGGGFYARALDRRDMRITYGVNLTTFFYDKNLRHFTYGQGGYFSPQNYFSVAVPVEWTGSGRRYSYKINAALGIQSFHEDGSAAFPNDDGLQTAIQNLLATDAAANITTDAVGGFSAKSSTGIGFNFGGAFEYLIAPNLIAGARAGIDNARDYQEGSILGYIRFTFNGQRSVSSPPSLLMPYYDFGDPTL